MNIRIRLGTLLNAGIWEDPRIGHWADALVTPLLFGLVGYLRVCSSSFAEEWFPNADGMPVEWLVEGGAWLLPLIILIVIVATYLVSGALRAQSVS